MCTLLMPLMCLPRRATLSNYFTKGQKLSTPSTFQENTAREEQILLTTPHLFSTKKEKDLRFTISILVQRNLMDQHIRLAIHFPFGTEYRRWPVNKQPCALRKNHLILLLI